MLGHGFYLCFFMPGLLIMISSFSRGRQKKHLITSGGMKATFLRSTRSAIASLQHFTINCFWSPNNENEARHWANPWLLVHSRWRHQWPFGPPFSSGFITSVDFRYSGNSWNSTFKAQNPTCQFKALLFGLSTAPIEFTQFVIEFNCELLVFKLTTKWKLSGYKAKET